VAVFWVVVPCRLVQVYHTSLHGATTQKTAIFILTAVKTASHTCYWLVIDYCISKSLDSYRLLYFTVDVLEKYIELLNIIIAC
jgi:hypothetical protein